MNPIQWQWCDFAQLSNHDVYAMLALRSEVFVVEQQCIYHDIDGLDLAAWHLLGWQELQGRRSLVAYLRCLPAGVKFAELSLGRVISSAQVRGSGAGRALLSEGLRRMDAQFPAQAIRIAAQQYLLNFYQQFGFVACSAPFDEDGILHVDMLRQPAS